MRILKKAVLLPIACTVCGCVYQPSKKDLRASIGCVLEWAPCPVCRKHNLAKFEKENDDAKS